MSKKYVIIVAGGQGLRMGNDIPKQFLLLNNLPILMHTIKAFYDYDSAISIILAIPKDHFSYWEKIKSDYNFTIPHKVVEGGSQRFFSVKNALDTLHDEDALVAIHDGVRPLVSTHTIDNCFQKAAQFDSAIPVIDSVDSVRYVSPGSNKSLPRNHIKLVQTPQTFNVKEIKKAFTQEFSELFTDDASVFEAYGNRIELVEGNIENIKITKPSDLLIAEAFLAQAKKKFETQ